MSNGASDVVLVLAVAGIPSQRTIHADAVKHARSAHYPHFLWLAAAECEAVQRLIGGVEWQGQIAIDELVVRAEVDCRFHVSESRIFFALFFFFVLRLVLF